MKLISWSQSDIGRKREHNEDSYLSDDGLRLYAVADGMGGHQGGDKASRMAIDVLHREIQAVGDFEAAAPRLVELDPLFSSQPSEARITIEDVEQDATANTDPKKLTGLPPAAGIALRFAARVAGRAIFDAAQADPRLSGMGTTLTAALVHRERMHVVHVGDSRGFLYRDGKLEQVTEDHSWIAEQVKAGMLTEAEAKESKFRHIITRSVGFEREVDVDLFGIPIVAGDCFLLCSDGMSNYVETVELERILRNTYYRKVPQLLVDLANDRGGDDNITVVMVYAANDAQ